MPLRLITLAVLGSIQIAACLPAVTLHDLEVADDTMSVGSYVREVRAAPPENYHKTYQNEGDGEIGYSRKKSGGGKKGYQHFDTFHKKAGDAYEFEKQDSYGLDEEEQAGAHSERKEKKADKYQDTPSEHEGEYESEDTSSESRGAHDGNGGIEADGHDPSDYTLPEKYTYGTGDEYNF